MFQESTDVPLKARSSTLLMTPDVENLTSLRKLQKENAKITGDSQETDCTWTAKTTFVKTSKSIFNIVKLLKF